MFLSVLVATGVLVLFVVAVSGNYESKNGAQRMHSRRKRWKSFVLL